MPIDNPTQVEIFNDDYAQVGEFVGEGDLLPYYNPADSGNLIRPGEPILVAFGPAGEEQAFLSQGPIRPGDYGYLFRPGHWMADLPCTLTANVVFGQELFWDQTEDEVALEGDVTNGFLVGYAGYAIDPNAKNTAPSLDTVNRVICGGTASGNIRVISRDEVSRIAGSVSSF